MAVQIQLRRDTAANWLSVNPVLAQGELGVETDTGRMKLGNGVDSWDELAYNPFAASLNDLTDVVLTSPSEFQSLQYDGTNWVNNYASVVTYVRNAEATTLTTGTVVYLFGATGDHATVKRADNDSDTTSSKTVGIVAANIASAQNGPVITRGYVDGIDLSVGYSAGDILWLGEDGAFTKTKPSAPEHLVFIGVVVRATNNGIVYVATQNGYELEELHDVKISDLSDGQFLRYNSASTMWVNDTINLGTDTAGDYVESLVAGTGLTITNNSGEGSTPTLAIGQAVGTSASVTFAQVTLNNEPSASNHAVTKQYVDAVSAGINWHLSAKLATATILPFLPDYDNGASGVGATLTATENGRLSIDGINATTNDRVLVKNQSSALQNGIYSVTAQGSASAVYVLTRTTDFDGSVNDYIVRGDALYIGSGSVNGNQGFIVNSVGTSGENLVHVVGTDDITFTQFTGTANIIAGTGITKSGNTLSIGQDVATSASVTFARVYGEFTGNADTATALATPRNIQLAGAVTGTVPFNGSASVEILTTMNSTLDSLTDVSALNPGENTYLKWVSTGWEPDVINLGTDTTGNYMVDLTQGTGVTITHTPSEGSNATIAIGQDVGTSASVTFGQVSAPLVGNATSATTLQTSRNIAGQAFNGSADISIAPTDLTGVTATASELNVLDGITSSTAELNILDGVTASYTEINVLDGITASTAELNILDGATLSTTELNYVDGVTSAIQTQLDAKASSTASPVITLGGDLSGSATLTNLGNATLTATIAANSVELGTDTTGNYVSSLVAGTGVTLTNNSGESATPTVAIGQDVSTSASVTFAQVTTTGKLYVGTDIHVGGVYYTENQTSLNLQDPLIYLNDGNTISDPDLGFAGNYNDGTYRHAGLFSDASDSHKFKFFKGLTVEPTHPIDTSHGSYAHADVVANTFESKVSTGTAPFTVASTTVVTNLNADYLDGNSSSYFLNTSSTLDDISNVSAASPSSGQFLKWNGSAWVPDSIPTINALDDIGDVSASAPSNGQFLKWNGSAWVNDSIDLGTDTTGNYVNDITAGTGVTVTHTPGEGSSPTVAIGQAVGTASNVQFANVTATGLLTVGTTSGSEGGEIQLLPASTGNTLSGNITIDVYQNRLRIFEAGGNTRGVYIDLSAATAGVGTNLSNEVVTNAQTASYSLVLSDKGKLVEMNVGSANNLTVPLNSSHAFPVGTEINILQTGSGQTTVVATGGVTINGTPGLKLRAQWSYATLIKRATDTWVLVGDISA